MFGFLILHHSIMAKVNIGVIGSEKASKDNIFLAQELGREIARAGAVLICGGRAGIMEAASRGCEEEGGISIGILTSLDERGNQYLTVGLPTSLGFGRNILVSSASHVLIAVDGSYGTLSEIAFALNYGRKVVVIEGTGGTADFMADSPFEVYKTKSAKEAVAKALELARK